MIHVYFDYNVLYIILKFSEKCHVANIFSMKLIIFLKTNVFKFLTENVSTQIYKNNKKFLLYKVIINNNRKLLMRYINYLLGT